MQKTTKLPSSGFSKWTMRDHLVQAYVERHNNVRLNGTIGCIRRKVMLAGRQRENHSERDGGRRQPRQQRQVPNCIRNLIARY
jgi:hypothetical protein